MPEPNQQTYSDAKIVNYYSYLSQLQPAETTILELLKPQLSAMTMLDMGVGGGRTTAYFAPLVKKYIGIDYASEMVAACQQKFPKLDFQTADARDLSQFSDNSFDLVLFSFNGIDYVDHCDRLKILQEITRVAKPGAYFCFSTHNLIAISSQFKISYHLSLNLFSSYINLFMYSLLRLFNRDISTKDLATQSYAIIRDESHNFRLGTYYITPQAQLKQLDSYFENMQIYSWSTGELVKPTEDPAVLKDLWLYYLCQLRAEG